MLPIRRATLTMTGDLGKVAGAVVTDLYGEIWYFADPSQRPPLGVCLSYFEPVLVEYLDGL